jgi:hypothetical protein
MIKPTDFLYRHIFFMYSPPFIDELSFEFNEAPRSKLRGIKAELRRSLTRLRSGELRRGSPCLSSLQPAAGYSGEGE